jgi:acetolactate synthase-1/2/3 large subunit
MNKKYSDDITSWLIELNYTTCFFVAGGNIMHLIESFSSRLKMIPMISEVAAVIATDYFNETSSANDFAKGKAVALVTVGPGATNTVTAVAGAYIDGRELLLISGQVKSTDLKGPDVRQYGVQEIDGIPIMTSITKKSLRLETRLSESNFKELVSYSGSDRKGPVFLEICLDVQGSRSDSNKDFIESSNWNFSQIGSKPIESSLGTQILQLVRSSERPIILLGGGVSRSNQVLIEKIASLNIPSATTWHGADRISSDSPLYAGRPNLFGQRWSNIVLQQADLIVVLGSSLGLQQTGFNVSEFAPLSQIIQVDIDKSSLKDSVIENLISVNQRVEDFINFLTTELGENYKSKFKETSEWVSFISEVRALLPLVEECTKSATGYLNPFEFISYLSRIAPSDLNFIPCSSGGSYTTAMQVFEQKQGNIIVSSRGLGSMGIGLSGAIGAAISNKWTTWLIEGDGGILQNIQELGTLVQQQLPIKVIILSNDGYASIRTSQKKYFGGNYVGCDIKTGLGIPNFALISEAYGIDYHEFVANTSEELMTNVLLSSKPSLIEVKISPEQSFLPKIESRLNQDGSMESNPLHLMSPELPVDLRHRVLKYIDSGEG